MKKTSAMVVARLFIRSRQWRVIISLKKECFCVMLRLFGKRRKRR